MDRLSGLPRCVEFEAILDPAMFQPLPDDWVIGLTDVVQSTAAIGEGRYKAVNIAGAAAISAMMNALGTRRFAFMFGGDGCAFALPASDTAVATRVLAETAAWVRDDLALTLRTAVVPMGEIRRAGYDVRLVLFTPTEHVAYAMFDGGGIAYAEAEMKAGRYGVEPLGPGARPDLKGLSCRWQPLKSRRGTMISIVLRPLDAPTAEFRKVVGGLLALLGEGDHPVPPEGPTAAIVSSGNRLEALASAGGPLWRRRLAVAAHNFLGWFLFATNLKVGSFDPKSYRSFTARNADAKKFGDSLLLTVDCSKDLAARARAYLTDAEGRKLVRYGMVSQDAALMTCIVPSTQDNGHFHFIDGAGGGYAAAAKAMK